MPSRMPENPLSDSSSPQLAAHLFAAKKSGRRNPLSHTRFFVVDSHRREVSYWRTETEAKEGDLSKRRGVVKVKRASASNSKAARNAAAKAACIEAESNRQHFKRTNTLQRHNLQRHNASSSSSSDGVGDTACRCSLTIEDDNGRTFHLKGMSKHDVDIVVDIFCSFPAPETRQEQSNSVEYVQSQFDKYRESQSMLSDEDRAAQVAQEKKHSEYMELNSIRTELRDRDLDTIGRKEELELRLLRAKAKEDRAANVLITKHPRLVESFKLKPFGLGRQV